MADVPSGLAELRRHWKILLTCFVGVMLGVASVPFYILGPLAKFFEASLGWSSKQVLTTVPFWAAGLTLGIPIAGKLCDRFRARPLALVKVSLLGGLLITVPLAATHGIWTFRVVYFLIGLLTAGTIGVIYTRVINGTFDQARGLALGITLSGTGITSTLAPLFVHAVAPRYGLAGVYYGAAAVILIVSLPILYAGLAHATSPHRIAPGAIPRPIGGSTLREALRAPSFYLMLLPFMLLGSIIGPLQFDLVPALLDRDTDGATAAGIASLLGVSLIIGRLTCGWMLDRLPAGAVGAVVFGGGACGCYLFSMPGSSGPLLAVITIGLLNGAEQDIFSFMVARTFGLRHYGQIYGCGYAGFTLAAIAGPFVGASLLQAGSHQLLYSTGAVIFVVATACMVALWHFNPTASPRYA